MTILEWWHQFRKRGYCTCGNPHSCEGKYKNLALYDISGGGRDRVSVNLNYARASRCTKFWKAFAKNWKGVG